MLTVNSRKTLSRFLILAATGLALSSHAASAAPPAGDAQAQARALVTGVSAGASPTASIAPILGAAYRPSRDLDPQEQAQAVLVGAQTPGPVAARGVAVRTAAIRTVDIRSSAARSHGAQESAQRMILGVTE
jgi:hypothetical protein